MGLRKNRDGILKYWEERLQENSAYDNTYTIGMRGMHDSVMPGGGTTVEKVARLQHVIADQRELLADRVNSKVEQVPQIFVPYKEVLPLYQNGLQVPDDVTLVWPDDNHGYIRQLSTPQEQRRSSGAGVYYHVSYWGAPADHLWLCTTPPSLIWERCTKLMIKRHAMSGYSMLVTSSLRKLTPNSFSVWPGTSMAGTRPRSQPF